MNVKELRDTLNDIIKNHGEDVEVVFDDHKGHWNINQAYYHGDNKVILSYINFAKLFL